MNTNIFSFIDKIDKNILYSRVTEFVCHKLSINDKECVSINGYSYGNGSASDINKKFGISVSVYNITFLVIAMMNYATGAIEIQKCIKNNNTIANYNMRN